MNTNQNKQLTELSDEELKQVNGGFVPSHIVNIVHFFAHDLCPEGVPDELGNCSPGPTVAN